MSLGPYRARKTGATLGKKKPAHEGTTGITARTPGTYTPPKSGGGIGGIAGGSAPAAPAPPPVAPFQWDPQTELGIAGITSARDATLAQLLEQEQMLRTQIGLVQQPNGTFAVDLANPAGRAAQLQRDFQNARRGDTNSYASRGILRSGAYQRMQAERNRGELMGMDQLGRALTEGLAGITAARQNATSSAQSEIMQLLLGSAQRTGADPAQTPAPAAPAKPASSGIIVRRSAHNGRMWKYRKGASGKLIPIGPA